MLPFVGFRLNSVLLRHKHRSCISVTFVVTCSFCICLCSASSMLSSKEGVGSIIINDGSPLCCCYHSGVKFGVIVSCSSAPASASHLCTTGCHIISVQSAFICATGCSFLLSRLLLCSYPCCVLLVCSICALLNFALILVVYLRNALRATSFALIR